MDDRKHKAKVLGCFVFTSEEDRKNAYLDVIKI